MPANTSVPWVAPPQGLVGATTPTRWVGRHDGGAPTSGTFQVGDYTIDATTPGLWLCTTAGTPGTWTNGFAGTPSGPAGGDLSGTYPNPSVAKVNGTSVPATPSANQAIVATGGTAATWQAIANTVFGRSGTVVATSGDYSVAQVTGAAPIASPTFTGITTAPEFSASGLTGATAASRYVGATASGAPASGTFAVGDFIIDQTGKLFVCTVAGTPGTWVQVGGANAGVTTTLAGSGAGNYTTNSAAFVDIDAVNLGYATVNAKSGDKIRIQFQGSGNDGAGNSHLTLNIAGTDVGDTNGLAFTGTSVNHVTYFQYDHVMASGTQVLIKARYANDSSTTTFLNGANSRPRMFITNLGQTTAV